VGIAIARASSMNFENMYMEIPDGRESYAG